MNKKGQITLNEVFIVVVLALLGVAFWFIDDGIRNWIMQRFPNSNTFMIGIIIIGLILFFMPSSKNQKATPKRAKTTTIKTSFKVICPFLFILKTKFAK